MMERDLGRVELFRGLEPQQLSLIAHLARQRAFQAGDIVFSQGQPATHIYLLLRGTVAIRFKPEDGEALTVAQLESGGVFGWSAALGHGRYTSAALCQSDCETLVIAGDALRRLCETHPETGVLVLERLAEVIAQRLESTHDQVLALLHQGMIR
ncbi:MAG: cyclic nucleotide-binding domain-containing protein [Anaerolineales bacterium]|jgi:CRP-like cAMP-binding protein